MTGNLTDTSPEAAAVQLAVLRRLGPERRSELAMSWSDEMRLLALHGIRDRHPEFGHRRAVLEFARLNLGEQLFVDAFEAALADPE